MKMRRWLGVAAAQQRGSGGGFQRYKGQGMVTGKASGEGNLERWVSDSNNGVFSERGRGERAVGEGGDFSCGVGRS